MGSAVRCVSWCVWWSIVATTHGAVRAQDASPAMPANVDPAPMEAHVQATYVWQRKPAFHALYAGPNSLSDAAERSYTFSGTAFVGLRLGAATELYANAEVIQGDPFSNLQGLGSPPNGEIQKVAGTNPKLYVPRIFVRHTWGLGGGEEHVDSAANQLATTRDRDRIVLTAGKFAITDVFDLNPYSHDARTQFLTWASLTHGPYDFAADAQGYTWGMAIEGVVGDWAARVGRFIVPEQSNGQALNTAIGRVHGDQVEVERHHRIGELAGAVRLLLWANRETMGRFDDAVALADATGATPDVTQVRRTQFKRGAGVHVEQALSTWIGAFARYGWADGHTETYSFEEVDRSLQAGVQFAGQRWGRARDTLGLLAIRNRLSGAHRRYLARGGLGFFIGDGRLDDRPEDVLEAYYNVGVLAHWTVGVDAQRVVHPAYNADRGPVNFYGVRVHAEY